METSMQSKPRVAYVLWDFPALSQTFVINELRWLVRNGYDVCVYYAVDPDKSATLDFEIQSYRAETPATLAALLRKHRRQVMHSFFCYPAATRLSWPAAKDTGIPFTFGAHAVDIFHYKNDGRNRVAEMGKDSHCLRVLVPGSFHRAYLMERGVPWEKLVVCPQAVDLSGLPQAKVPQQKSTRKRVITVARFVEKKGIENLLLAAKQLPEDIDVEIHGYGPLEDRYREVLAEQKVSNVSLKPPIRDRAEYVRVMTGADLFIAPSIRASNGDMDGIPTVLFEAMTLGVPVAASRVSSIPDLVNDGVTGLLMNPGDPDDVARAIQRFFSLSEEEVKGITVRANERAQEMSNVERTMATLQNAWAAPRLEIV